MLDNDAKRWYVLSATDGPGSLEGQFERLSAARVERGGEPVEFFMPTCLKMSALTGNARLSRQKLIGNYIFVRDTYQGILEVKQTVRSLWLLPHPDHIGGQRALMTVTDREMDLFKAIARAHANQLPCYPIGSVDLDEGDKVQIVGGEFDGMSGTLRCSQGQSGGKVLMALGNLMLVASPDIKPQYIRILQFGKGNRHPYRHFEAHLPRALRALDRIRHGEALTEADLAAMTVFVRRFEDLEPATVNIASQHATLMLMSYTALQDRDKMLKWRVRCDELLAKVKSETQRAWQLTFMYVATGEEELQVQAFSIVSKWTIAPRDRKRACIQASLVYIDFERLLKKKDK